MEKLAAHAEAAWALQLHHVKPHGALYNQADRDARFAAALVAGITENHRMISTPSHGAASPKPDKRPA